MTFISENDLNKIESDLKDKIKSKLLEGFRNRKTLLVIKVDSVTIKFDIDEGESNRDNIVISLVNADAKVWVDNNDNNSQGNDQIQLRINSVRFSFNEEIKEFELANENDLVLIDMS
ncbi:hypothetical protein NLG42_14115 [Flavobacterium plurextorum]|uniref:hypothetical protein n=1 Tax=Flavobacterium TaxID=237 RepID=UPI00214DEBE2|nr:MULTISPECIES: hypothetical protein [Flavobacterium]UUW07239.1 hypothetical protein NLG42_14115 [Flavobacterium plurextorum]